MLLKAVRCTLAGRPTAARGPSDRRPKGVDITPAAASGLSEMCLGNAEARRGVAGRESQRRRQFITEAPAAHSSVARTTCESIPQHVASYPAAGQVWPAT